MTVSSSNTDRVMARIAALIARADHRNTPAPEATLCREQAEKLMTRHRIDESSLTVEERALQGIRPQVSVWDICSIHDSTPALRDLATAIADHVGLRWSGRVAKRPDLDGDWGTVRIQVFGFESDTRYGAMLLQACKLAISEDLSPSVDPTLSDQINAYRLRRSGLSRAQVASALWGSSMKDGNAHGKISRLYKAECIARDEMEAVGGKGFDSVTYRNSFADAFFNEVVTRLYRLRVAAGQDGSALVLASRLDEVNDLFYDYHPNRRPATDEQLAKWALEASDRLGSMELLPANKRPKAPRYRKYVEPKYDARAERAGRASGSRVDLGGSAGTRLES